MKLGILTQPLKDNYGGLLQAYALKTSLERLGHKIEIINRLRDTVSLNYRLKQAIRDVIGRVPKFKPTENQQDLISQNTRYFVQKYIKDISAPIYTSVGLKAIADEYDGFVVGSDQCWRPRYSPQISNYFLDFVDDPDTICISYAASFGVDTWEFTAKQTASCKTNIHKFKAISVREKDGIKLCEKYLGVTAVHVLDPTMLLKRDDYQFLIDNENEKSSDEKLLHYVLDKNSEKEELINYVADSLGYKIFSAHQKCKPNPKTIINIEDCIYPKVTTWLNAFNQAEFVITDSFHGTVFSLLFNKPFLVIANESRGKSRFESLLQLVGLEGRLISKIEMFDKESVRCLPEIDWDSVNMIIEKERERSLNFLKSNLQ